MEKAIKWFESLSPVCKGWVVGIVTLLLVLPWLGLTEFNTKGEPREAVVSMSMIQQEDPILPVNNDIDIPYKPMMFHWLGAAVGMANGGEVNEFTARVPSALALALLVGATFWFYARYGKGGTGVAALTAVILAGCFELHRAGTNARVDMVLTSFMVVASYLLYRWALSEKRFSSFPVGALLAISAATLTKGPVGIVIPLLICWIFLICRRYDFWKNSGWMALFAILSMILPGVWYWLAWQSGGREFLDLVMEENFGRMTGTMTYEAHVNPWHYNFWITAAGFLPWTLLALIGGVVVLLFRKGIFRAGTTAGNAGTAGRNVGRESGVRSCKMGWLRRMDPVTLFSLISLVVVFLFFTLPSSKRSVYLMPAYPFIAWFAARFFLWLGGSAKARVSLRIYGSVLGVIAILAELLLLVFRFMPAGTVTFSGRHAAANYATLDSLSHPGFLCWLTAGLLFATGVVWFVGVSRKGWSRSGGKMLSWISLMTVTLFLTFDSGIQPAVLNVKSLKEESAGLRRMIGDKGELYEFLSMSDETTANRYHFFELDFYMDDKVKNFRKHKPEEGYLAIMPSETETWLPRFEQEGYRFTPVYLIAPPARKEQVAIYHFTK